MLITSSFNPRKVLTSMLKSSGVDTNFIGEIYGTNGSSPIRTSSGVMAVSQGDAAPLNGIDSYSLYINNMLYNNGDMHTHPNQTSRAFYFQQQTGCLHANIKYQEKWNNSSDDWMVAYNPDALDLPDQEFTADPSEPDEVFYTSSACYYTNTVGNPYAGSPANLIDPAVLNAIPSEVNVDDFIVMRILSSPRANEFRILYDVFSADYQNGQMAKTSWVFYINSEYNKFTRIKMDDTVIVGVDASGIITRTDKIDAVRTVTQPRTKPTSIELSSNPRVATSGVFADVTAAIIIAGELAINSAGTVTFYNDGNELGTSPVVDGLAIITNIWNSKGTYNITGIYSGDGVTSEAVASGPLIMDVI